VARVKLLQELNTQFGKLGNLEEFKYTSTDILTSGILDPAFILDETQLTFEQVTSLKASAERVFEKASDILDKAKKAYAFRVLRENNPELRKQLDDYISKPEEYSAEARVKLLQELNTQFGKLGNLEEFKYTSTDILTSGILDPAVILDEKQLTLEQIAILISCAKKSGKLVSEAEKAQKKRQDILTRDVNLTEISSIIKAVIENPSAPSVLYNLKYRILNPVVILDSMLLSTKQLDQILKMAEEKLTEADIETVERACAFSKLRQDDDLRPKTLECLQQSLTGSSEINCLDLLEEICKKITNDDNLKLIVSGIFAFGMLDPIAILNFAKSDIAEPGKKQLSILLKYANKFSVSDAQILNSIKSIYFLTAKDPTIIEALLKYIDGTLATSGNSKYLMSNIWFYIKEYLNDEQDQNRYNDLYNYIPHPKKPADFTGLENSLKPGVDTVPPGKNDLPNIREVQSASARTLAYGAPIHAYDYEVFYDSADSDKYSGLARYALAVLGTETESNESLRLTRKCHVVCNISSKANRSHITAILLRMKLLGTVFAIKREISEVLKSHYKKEKEFRQVDAESAPALELFDVFSECRWVFKHSVENGGGGRKDFRCLINLIKSCYHKRVIGKFLESLINVFKNGFYKLEDYIARLLEHFKYQSIFLTVFGFLALILGFFNWVWSGIWEFDNTVFGYNIYYGVWSVVGALILAMGLILEGFNFQTYESREDASRHEDISKMLRDSLSRLTQFNVSVQVGNVDQDSLAEMGVYAPLPETFIFQIDNVLKTHAIVKNLESSIIDRQRSVDDKIAEIRKESAKARRIVLGAGGAIFTGFFAHEVGMSIIEFKHIKESSDPQSFLNWVINNTHNEAAIPKPGEPHKTIEHKPSTPEEFHHHELTSVGWVLLITFLAVMAAMVLAARRPPDEEGAGKRE
jgi:hypothetical protein